MIILKSGPIIQLINIASWYNKQGVSLLIKFSVFMLRISAEGSYVGCSLYFTCGQHLFIDLVKSLGIAAAESAAAPPSLQNLLRVELQILWSLTLF